MKIALGKLRRLISEVNDLASEPDWDHFIKMTALSMSLSPGLSRHALARDVFDGAPNDVVMMMRDSENYVQQVKSAVAKYAPQYGLAPNDLKNAFFEALHAR